MIRVLQVVHSMNVGGIETFLMNVYRNIDRSKVQFDFLLSSNEKGTYEDEIVKLGGKIYRVPPKREGIFKYKKALRSFFEEHKEYNILHAHMDCLSSMDTLIIATKAGVKTRIIHSRNNNHPGIVHNMLHKINKFRIDRFTTDYFAISDLAAKWLFSNKVFKEHKYKIIGNGIDINNFIFNEEIRKNIREKLGITKLKVIGHVGRFAEQKNHKFLIDIFSKVCQMENDVVMLLLGEGPLKKQIENKVEEMNLKDKIYFLGVKPNVYDYMQAMDMFLLPSLYEGLGRVLIEAQAADLPCVASAEVIPDNAKILDTFQSIKLDASSNEWAEAVIKALEYTERKNRRKEIQKAGYDINFVAKELQEFYIERNNIEKGGKVTL